MEISLLSGFHLSRAKIRSGKKRAILARFCFEKNP
jgi:hypothetical protein